MQTELAGEVVGEGMVGLGIAEMENEERGHTINFKLAKLKWPGQEQVIRRRKKNKKKRAAKMWMHQRHVAIRVSAVSID